MCCFTPHGVFLLPTRCHAAVVQRRPRRVCVEGERSNHEVFPSHRVRQPLSPFQVSITTTVYFSATRNLIFQSLLGRIFRGRSFVLGLVITRLCCYWELRSKASPTGVC
ncbi:hypothetical protein LZ30DRAFT_212068 [Colletotrichum cereale]|nr:hypothetical protein LZ30DRAFT_212068 [Colletotrichum cereale]